MDKACSVAAMIINPSTACIICSPTTKIQSPLGMAKSEMIKSAIYMSSANNPLAVSKAKYSYNSLVI